MKVWGRQMKSMVLCGILVGCMGMALVARGAAVETEASSPRSPAIAVYDQGFGLVSEMRRLTPAAGENLIRFRQLPPLLDPSTISFIPLVGLPGLEVREQQFLYDPAAPETLMSRFVGRTIKVQAAGATHEGRLLHAPRWADTTRQPGVLVLETPDRAGRAFLDAESVQQVVLPEVRRHAYIEPVLRWRAWTEQEGPQNIRLSYRVDDIRWEAAYEVVLGEDDQTAYFSARIGLENRSGGHFENAAIQLISTERGLLRDRRRSAVTAPRDRVTSAPALRYAYGAEEPSFEETVAGLAPVYSFRLQEPVTLRHGDHRFVQYARVDALPVSRFYVYDGVRFDRFQRHRRNDWNYGTESHSVVEMHLHFENESAVGLGVDLPPGRFSLYQRKEDETVVFLGEDRLLPTSVGESGHVLLGAARGLRGERERTGYTEITPLRVYEESFQIRLENNTEETVEIRVVEHLYRWHEFEIVRADAEYEKTADQTIEFRPTLRPGGRRTIHYTVRYSW